MIILLTGGAIAWGWLSYRFIEKPIISFFMQKGLTKWFLKRKERGVDLAN